MTISIKHLIIALHVVPALTPSYDVSALWQRDDANSLHKNYSLAIPVSGPSEAVLASSFLKELATGELYGCYPVLLYTNDTIRSAVVTSFLFELNLLASVPFMAYDIDVFLSSASLDSSVFRRGASNATVKHCLAYYMFSSLSRVEMVFASFRESDVFAGATQYVVVYTGTDLNITALQSSSVLLHFYNTLYLISSNGTAQDSKYPIRLLSNCPFCRSGQPEIILRNRWGPERGLSQETSLFPDLYRDCNGHTFRGVALIYPPIVDYSEGNATHPVILTDCLDRNIMEVISRFYNFTYVLYEPADGDWGLQFDNGSFNGLIGEVQRKEADFTLDVAITAERGEVVDFTIGYFAEPMSFVTSKPQGCRWPQTTSVRLYCIFWILFAMFATMSYLSNLTAFLTVPELSPSVDTLEALSFSSFTWGLEEGGTADYQLFKTSTVPLYMRIFKDMSICPTLVDCIQRTLDERYAFISWRLYLRDAIAQDFTDKNGYTQVYLAKESFWPVDVGYTLQKGSPLKRGFDSVLRRLIEGGFIEKWVSDLIQKRFLSAQRAKRAEAVELGETVNTTDENMSLSVHHLQGVFFVYFVGMLLASLLFLLEIATQSLKESNKFVIICFRNQ
ncbi:hypothetical protein SK128_000836 [Halocaridina rubra]|uniref:Uncharacterized protein n=1 Tax=Halocaridina rubra TaxID=373956 RepID=A0AAN8XB94_HALRR